MEPEVEEAVDEPTIKSTRHYIDNERLYEDFVWFHAEYQKFKDGIYEHPPKMTEYMGEAFIKIAQGFSNYHKFRRYTNAWKEDMIGNAIEACVRYTRAFDPSRSKNPFAYITKTVYTAFVKKIKAEKTQQYIKYKLFDDSDGFAAFSDDEDFGPSGGPELTDQYVDVLDFIDHFENSSAYAGKKVKKEVEVVEDKPEPKTGLAKLED